MHCRPSAIPVTDNFVCCHLRALRVSVPRFSRSSFGIQLFIYCAMLSGTILLGIIFYGTSIIIHFVNDTIDSRRTRVYSKRPYFKIPVRKFRIFRILEFFRYIDIKIIIVSPMDIVLGWSPHHNLSHYFPDLSFNSFFCAIQSRSTLKEFELEAVDFPMWAFHRDDCERHRSERISVAANLPEGSCSTL